MSERGAFTTMSLVYCSRCEAALRAVLEAEAAREGPKFFHLAPHAIEDPLRLRNIAGRVGGLYAGEERHTFEYDLRDKIEAAICHSMRIAVLCDDERHDAILTFKPPVKL